MDLTEGPPPTRNHSSANSVRRIAPPGVTSTSTRIESTRRDTLATSRAACKHRSDCEGTCSAIKKASTHDLVRTLLRDAITVAAKESLSRGKTISSAIFAEYTRCATPASELDHGCFEMSPTIFPLKLWTMDMDLRERKIQMASRNLCFEFIRRAIRADGRLAVIRDALLETLDESCSTMTLELLIGTSLLSTCLCPCTEDELSTY